MVQLGSLKLDEPPKIVVSVKDTTPRTRGYPPAPFDIVELRIDLFSSLEFDRILRVVRQCKPYPTIATIRSKAEGGGWSLSEKERFLLFKKIIPHVDAVDIELSAKTILGGVVDTARQKKKKVIVSYHDFGKTPSLSVLNRILKRGCAAGGDMVKVAAFANKRDDIQRLAGFTLANKKKKIVTIAMGPIGVLSRLFFPALGSLLTYAHSGEPTAPGQMNRATFARLIKQFYRLR